MMRLANSTRGLRESLSRNLYLLLALLVILILTLSYAAFFTTSISPELTARDKLAVQLNDARKALVEARKIPEAKPADMQTRIAEGKVTLTAQLAAFLTDPQASQLLSLLYQYANDAGVVVSDLQTVPGPTPGPKDVYRVTNLKLQVQGSSHGLVDFVARTKSIPTKGLVINNATFIGGEAANATMQLDISLYTFSQAQIDALTSAQPITTTAPVAGTRAAPPGATPGVTSFITPPARPTATWTPIIIYLPSATPTGSPVPTAPPTLTPVPVPTRRTTLYIVHVGDTLFSISRRYNTTVAAIKTANGLVSDNILPGQQLIIPIP